MNFPDLDAFQALPRLSKLTLSPDGRRLVTCVASLDAAGKKWVSSLWEIDPTGAAAARELTGGPRDDGNPAFAAGGELLFTSKASSDGGKDDDEPETVELWLLDGRGKPRQVGTRPGGVTGLVVRGDRVVVASDTLPGSGDGEDDARRRKDRKDRKVSAILHRSYPVRYWDHDLGPGQHRLLTGTLDKDQVGWCDLTPEPDRSLDEASFDLSADGSFLVTTWSVLEHHGAQRTTLRRLDTATGGSHVLADEVGEEWSHPSIAPDGSQVAAIRATCSTATDPGDSTLVLLASDGSTRREIGGWDRWPTEVRWTPDSSALIVTADEQGRGPVFRVEGQQITRLTTDDGAYTDLCVSPDGKYVYALRSAIDSPPTPVRLDAHVPGPPYLLPSPAGELEVPGTLTEVTAQAADGRALRAWLALPPGAGPHPTVLWIHGGPLGSWNAWSWRWCPWLLVAQGYAVLLADPALSTGYGRDYIAAGWGDWGGAAYDDLMRLTDAALERPDLDPSRTAAMGGSFGGYMANWVAGHTDRFRAIVTHASLWNLSRFGTTTDAGWYWAREMSPEMMAANDPSAHVDAIVTPMLVIHGDKDYRVPVGESLGLWWDLCSAWGDPAQMPHRFLYFPDENHWVLTPGHSLVWYQTVLAFLDQHLLGRDEVVPALLS